MHPETDPRRVGESGVRQFIFLGTAATIIGPHHSLLNLFKFIQAKSNTHPSLRPPLVYGSLSSLEVHEVHPQSVFFRIRNSPELSRTSLSARMCFLLSFPQDTVRFTPRALLFCGQGASTPLRSARNDYAPNGSVESASGRREQHPSTVGKSKAEARVGSSRAFFDPRGPHSSLDRTPIPSCRWRRRRRRATAWVFVPDSPDSDRKGAGSAAEEYYPSRTRRSVSEQYRRPKNRCVNP